MKTRFVRPLLIALVALPLAVFAAAAKGAKPAHISKGERVKLEDHLVAGKTVIFDFYSTYCPPCMEMSPKLDQLHAKRADIVVVKVDVNRPLVKGIDWKSPVIEQFKLESLPHLKVYGPNGKLLAEDSDEASKARDMVEKWFE